MSPLLSTDYMVQGTNLLAGYNNRSISLINLSESGALSLKEEFTAVELGLVDNSLIAASISLDDKTLYLLSYFQDPETSERHTNLYRYSINQTGMQLEEELEDLFTGYNSYGTSMYLSNDHSQLLITSEYQDEIKIVSIDSDSGSMSLSHSSDIYTDALFAMLDSTNSIITLVYNNYYSSTNSCLESYRLNANGTKSLIDTITCQSSELPSRINSVEYNSSTGHFLLKGNSEFAIINLDNAGGFSPILNTQTQDVFINAYTNGLMLKDSTISFVSNSYPNSFDVYSYLEDGTVTLESSTSLSYLTGSNYINSLRNIKKNAFIFREGYSSEVFGIITLADDFSVNSQASSLQNDNVIDQIGLLKIAVKENLFISVTDSSLNLISSQNSKQFENIQSIELNYNYYSYATEYIKLDESTYLVLGSSRYIVFKFNQETDQIELITDDNYTDPNNITLQINNNNNQLLKSWIDDQYLVAKTSNDRISIFELVDSKLVFKEYLVDLSDGIEGIYNTTNFMTLDNHIFMVQGQTGYIYQLSVLDGQVTQAADPYYFSGLSTSSQILEVGNKRLLIQNNYVMSFGLNDNELELLTISPISNNYSQSRVVLDERHILLSNYTNVEVYTVGQQTGALDLVDTIKYTDIGMPINNTSLYNLEFDGQNIWYESNDYQRTIGKLNVNRTPLWLDDNNYSITLNQGVSQSYLMSDYIVDLDLGDSVTFIDVELPASLLLTADDSIVFDGSIESIAQATVSASDNQLTANFIFDLLYNFAPSLVNPSLVFDINQNETIAMDVSASYSDNEDDRFSLSLEVNSSTLSMLANGTLTGYFSEYGLTSVAIVATDERGATKTQNIEFNVNGAPILSGSALIEATAGEAITLDLSSLFSDPESDSFTITTQGLVAGLSLTEGNVSGTIAESGNYTSLVSATDSKGAKVEALVTFKVSNQSGGGGAIIYLLGFLLILVGVKRF